MKLVVLSAAVLCPLVFGACATFKAAEETEDAPRPEASSDPTAGVNTRNDEGPATPVPVTKPAAPAAPSAKCDPRAPFERVSLLPALNTGKGEVGARLSPDERTIYFTSARETGLGFELYVATRSSVAAPFDSPSRITELSTAQADESPTVSADGLELVFARRVDTYSTSQIFVTRRENAGGAFAAATPLPGKAAAGGDIDAFLASNGDVYFASDRLTTLSFELFRLPRLAGGGFGEPEQIRELGTATHDSAPVVSADLSTMYFMSTRTDGNGEPSGDIWVAHRSSPSAPFEMPVRVADPDVNAKGSTDLPTWISPDGCRLYLSSRRTGVYQLYVATRSR